MTDEAQPLRTDTHEPQPDPYPAAYEVDAHASGAASRGTVTPGPFAATGADAGSTAPLPGESRPFYRRRRVQLAAVLLAVLALGITLAQRASRPASPVDPAQQTPLVSVVVPGKTPTTAAVSFTGAIAARYDIPIGVEDSGRIAAVLVEAGDRVRAGQVLARLDTSVVGSQVASLTAQLEQARAEAVLAEQELKRAEQIVESVAALSQSDVDRRRADVLTKNARVRAAEAQLAESRARFGRTEVRQTAVLSDGTQNYVMIVGEGDHVARRNVRIASTGPRGVVIAEGLDGAERVITTAGPFLREGEVVRVSEANAATPAPAAPAAAPAKPAAAAG